MSKEKISVKEVSLAEVQKVHEQITELEKDYIQKNFVEKTRGNETLIIAAYFDGKLAGYLIGYDCYADGSFYCWMAGVIPNFRRKGILKALMDYEEKWAKGKGYKKIRVKTRNIHRKMLSYFVKHGFDFTEIEKQPEIQEYRIMAEKSI